MEFAITFRGDLEKDRIVAICRQAEAAGFDYAWFFDSHALWRDSTLRWRSPSSTHGGCASAPASPTR